MQVVLASGNPGKLRELGALVAPLGWELVPQSRFDIAAAVESGESFLENALIKARHASQAARLAALADDSGIEVDALGGRPGVRSARYAGENASDVQNLERLLAELVGVPEQARTARYRCVIAFLPSPTAEPVIGSGVWEGRLLSAPRGRGGFGYDPIFVPRGLVETAAELAPERKDALSHRGQALRALWAALNARTEGA